MDNKYDELLILMSELLLEKEELIEDVKKEIDCL